MPRVSPFVWIVSALMVLALILLLVFSSCVPPEQSATPTAASTFATKTELQALQNVVSQKADNTAVDAVSKRVDSVNTRIDNLSGAGAAAGYTKAETYTKAEVDAMIAKLKSDQSWITGGGGEGSSGTELGTLVDRHNDIELYLKRVIPASDPISLSSGSGKIEFEVNVRNTSNSSRWVLLEILLSPHDSVVANLALWSAMLTSRSASDWSIDRTDPSASTRNTVYVKLKPDKDIWIKDKSVERFWIIIDTNVSASSWWDYRFMVRQTR